MIDVQIRPATSNDIEALAVLKKPHLDRHRAAFAAIARQRIEAAPPDGSVLLVAAAQALVAQVYLAMAGTETEPGSPNIQDLHVAEAVRGQGIGRQLIWHCETLAATHSFRRITISVNPTSNPGALALYQRLGYRDVGRPSYLDGVYDGNEDWVIDLAKTLDP